MALKLRTTPKHLSKFLIGALLLAWCIWLSLGFIIFGERSFVRINDCGDSNLPMTIASNAEPGSQLVGARNASMLCGFSHLSTWGWKLPDGLFRFLSPWLAYSMVMLLQRITAAVGTYWLARRTFDAHWITALVAACGYSLFCQFFINDSWSGFTYYDSLAVPGIPWILLGLGWAGENIGKGLTIAALSAAFGIGILYGLCGGYAFEMFVVLLAGVWILILFRPCSFWKSITILATFSAAWTLIMLPFVMDALQTAGASHRTETLTHQEPSAAIASAWRMLKQGYFDNWPFFVAMIIGLSIPPWRDHRHLKIASATVGCASIVLFAKAATVALRDHLGFLQGFQFQRFYLLLPFLVALAGASSLQRWLNWSAGQKASSRVILQSIGWIAAFACLIWVGNRSWGMQNLMAKTIIDGWSGTVFTDPEIRKIADHAIAARPSAPFRVVTVSNTGTSVWHPDMMASYGLESADGYVMIYSKRYHDYWGTVIHPHLAADPKLASYFGNWGNRAYVFGPTAGWPTDGSPVDAPSLVRLDLLSLANVRFILSPHPLSHPALKPILQRETGAMPKGYRRNFQSRLKVLREGFSPTPSLCIYENTGWLPRVYLANQITILKSSDEVLSALGQFSSDDSPILPAFLNREDLGSIEIPTPVFSPESATIRKLSPDIIDISTVAKSSSLLVISNTFDPRWKASIDGSDTLIFPVNHSFLGIVVPAGEHGIQFRYDAPKHPMAGAYHD